MDKEEENNKSIKFKIKGEKYSDYSNPNPNDLLRDKYDLTVIHEIIEDIPS